MAGQENNLTAVSICIVLGYQGLKVDALQVLCSRFNFLRLASQCQGTLVPCCSTTCLVGALATIMTYVLVDAGETGSYCSEIAVPPGPVWLTCCALVKFEPSDARERRFSDRRFVQILQVR